MTTMKPRVFETDVGLIKRVARATLMAVALFLPRLACAQLEVIHFSPTVTGSKAVIKLAMKNQFAARIESARAVVFQQQRVTRHHPSFAPAGIG